MNPWGSPAARVVAGAVVVGVAALVAHASNEARESVGAADETAARRAVLRAFETAPPVVPHPVASRGNRECLHCHSEILRIGDRVTVPFPHQPFHNCQQCHVGDQVLNVGFPVETLPTDWLGLDAPGPGTRAHEFAPPTMPHRVFMRERCLSCHSPDHPDEQMRTPHPERSQCLQCHVLQEDLPF